MKIENITVIIKVVNRDFKKYFTEGRGKIPIGKLDCVKV